MNRKRSNGEKCFSSINSRLQCKIGRVPVVVSDGHSTKVKNLLKINWICIVHRHRLPRSMEE